MNMVNRGGGEARRFRLDDDLRRAILPVQPKICEVMSKPADSEFQKLLERAQDPQNVEQPKQSQTTSEGKKESAKPEGEEQTAAKDTEDTPVAEDPQARVDQMVKMGAVVVGSFVNDGTVQEIRGLTADEEAGALTWQTFEVGRFVPRESAVSSQIESVQPQMEAEVQPQGEIELPEELTQAPLPVEDSTDVVEVEEKPQQLPETQAKPDAPAVVRTAHHAKAAVQPQERDEVKAEVTDAEQAPQRVFHDVEAAPIKVGETTRTSETEKTADVERQVDDRLVQALEQGETRVELQLTPEHLGAVKVEITRTAEGLIRVTLSAQTGETRGLLEKHADGLRGLLSERTQDGVQVEVRKEEESQRQSDDPYDGHNGQNHQQERRHHSHPRSGEDFLQQLRLGLIPVEDAQD